jgi:uncharacterized damage-inducible protein DinB
MGSPDVVQLDREDILSRAERSRRALLDALDRLTPDAFGRAEDGEWSTAVALRHVVWVECFWAGLVRAAQRQAVPELEVDEAIKQQLVVEASRVAGTPAKPLPEPPPYANQDEALRGLAESRRLFDSAVASLTAADLQRRFSGFGRVASLRFAVEHIIEHDWDHAVQITALAGQT